MVPHEQTTALNQNRPISASPQAKPSTQIARKSRSTAETLQNTILQNDQNTFIHNRLQVVRRRPGYGGHNYVLDTGSRQQIDAGDPSVQFAAQMDHLADAIRDGSEIRTPGEMGQRDVRLMEAIIASARDNRIVRLNKDASMKG